MNGSFSRVCGERNIAVNVGQSQAYLLPPLNPAASDGNQAYVKFEDTMTGRPASGIFVAFGADETVTADASSTPGDQVFALTPGQAFVALFAPASSVSGQPVIKIVVGY